MSDYFAANPDHAILVGIIGFFALSYFFGRSGRRPKRRGGRSAQEYYQRMLRGGWRDDG